MIDIPTDRHDEAKSVPSNYGTNSKNEKIISTAINNYYIGKNTKNKFTIIKLRF